MSRLSATFSSRCFSLWRVAVWYPVSTITGGNPWPTASISLSFMRSVVVRSSSDEETFFFFFFMFRAERDLLRTVCPPTNNDSPSVFSSSPVKMLP